MICDTDALMACAVSFCTNLHGERLYNMALSVLDLLQMLEVA